MEPAPRAPSRWTSRHAVGRADRSDPRRRTEQRAAPEQRLGDPAPPAARAGDPAAGRAAPLASRRHRRPPSAAADGARGGAGGPRPDARAHAAAGRAKPLLVVLVAGAGRGGRLAGVPDRGRCTATTPPALGADRREEPDRPAGEAAGRGLRPRGGLVAGAAQRLPGAGRRLHRHRLLGRRARPATARRTCSPTITWSRRCGATGGRTVTPGTRRDQDHRDHRQGQQGQGPGAAARRRGDRRARHGDAARSSPVSRWSWWARRSAWRTR